MTKLETFLSNGIKVVGAISIALFLLSVSLGFVIFTYKMVVS